MRFHLDHGNTYAARFELGGFERFASASMIASKFVDAGFANVTVWDNDDLPTSFPPELRANGSNVRYGLGTWQGPTVDVELPDQVKAIVLVRSVTAPSSPTSPAPSSRGSNVPVRLNITSIPSADSDFVLILAGLRLALFFF